MVCDILGKFTQKNSNWIIHLVIYLLKQYICRYKTEMSDEVLIKEESRILGETSSHFCIIKSVCPSVMQTYGDYRRVGFTAL